MSERDQIKLLRKAAAVMRVDPKAFSKKYKKKYVPVPEEPAEEKNAGYQLAKAMKKKKPCCK